MLFPSLTPGLLFHLTSQQPPTTHTSTAFDLFSIGVGPSSSHTVGPWRAANIFIEDLEKLGMTESIATLKITLYGSLAATGQGHGTVEALLMGFQGYDCETVDTAIVQPNFKSIVDTKTLALAGKHKINFSMDDIRWRYDTVVSKDGVAAARDQCAVRRQLHLHARQRPQKHLHYSRSLKLTLALISFPFLLQAPRTPQRDGLFSVRQEWRSPGFERVLQVSQPLR